jgi:hypothetical protein
VNGPSIISRRFLIFDNRWLQHFDAQMRGRRVLLLLDNAPSHITDGVELRYTTVHFLPPNSTSKIQPCDAGIISSFKAHYRRKFIRYLLERFEEGESGPAKLNVLQAIRYIREAWQQDVMPATISNCFRHVQIRDVEDGEIENVEQNDVINEIAQDIEALHFRDPMAIEDFLNPEEETAIEEERSIEEIMEVVGSSEIEIDDEDYDNDYEISATSAAEAVEGAEKVVRFLLQQKENFLEEISSQEKILRRLKLLKELSKKQTNVTDYFSI